MKKEAFFEELMANGVETQERMVRVKDTLEQQSFIGEDEHGLVRVVLKSSQLIDIQMGKRAMSFGDLQEATKAAINDAILKRTVWLANAYKTIQSDLNLNDFKLPF